MPITRITGALTVVSREREGRTLLEARQKKGEVWSQLLIVVFSPSLSYLDAKKESFSAPKTCFGIFLLLFLFNLFVLGSQQVICLYIQNRTLGTVGRTIPGSSEAIPPWPESAGRTRNFSSAYPHPPYPLVKNNCNHNRRYHLSCPILFECSVPWDTLRAETLNSVCVLVAQSYPTLRNPMDCSPPGSSVHGILQPRILEWVAIPFSSGPSQPRDWTQVSYIAGKFFPI